MEKMEKSAGRPREAIAGCGTNRLVIAIVIFITIFTASCDALYRAQLIADLPQDQQYKVRIVGRLESSWMLKRAGIKEISEKTFSGYSKILEINLIGPGVVTTDLANEFWNDVSYIELIRLSDGNVTVVKRENVRIYKADGRDIILYIKI